MSRYSVFRTATADEQITAILRYVAADSGDPQIALACLDRMEAEIRQLEDFPYVGSIPRYTALRRMGYRYLVSDRWLIFYKVNETTKTVMIYGVFDCRQDYLNLLR